MANEKIVNVKRALVSVFDKTGIVDFVKELVEKYSVEILSTGGTAARLTDAGVPIIKVSDFTKSPEMFDGRVKTLHPRIHGGILMRRDNPKDVEDAKTYGVAEIDMVVCNLYPFSDVIEKAETSLDDALEMIDIGGPTQIRAAAKSFSDVCVVSDPQDYQNILSEIKDNNGGTTLKTRMKLAQKVFSTMSLYDTTVHNYIDQQFRKIYSDSDSADVNFPELMVKRYKKVQMCRYGENWDQEGGFYVDTESKLGLQNMEQLHGKAISFNNWLDIDSCIQVLSDFELDFSDFHVTSIFKHTTPNGIAVDFESQLESCKRAFSCDPLSAFGGIWGFNKTLQAEVADYIINEKKVFVEVLLAPDFDEKALEILKQKENLRIIQYNDLISPDKRKLLYEDPEIRGVPGGAIIQDWDSGELIKSWDVKTQRDVSESEKKALIFAYRACKWAKSNSAVFAKEYETGIYTQGIGAGQQSRVHVVKLAAQKAEEFKHDLNGSVMGTDSFFPFPDGLEVTVNAGAKAIINPGGSIRDELVIKKADELGVSLVFCGKRVFRH